MEQYSAYQRRLIETISGMFLSFRSTWLSSISIVLSISLLASFFTPSLAGCLSLESKWLQVSAGLQDTFLSSGRSQQYCSLNGLDSSSDFQFYQSFSKPFRDRSKCTKYCWYHCQTHFPQFFSSLARSKYLFIFTFSFVRLIGLVGRAFADSPGDLVSVPGCVIPKTLKWYLIPPYLSLSNIRCVSRVKWSSPRKEVAPFSTLWCSSFEKGAFLSPSTIVSNFFIPLHWPSGYGLQLYLHFYH